MRHLARPFLRSYSSQSGPSLITSPHGTIKTTEWALYFSDAKGTRVSPWHDVPLGALNDQVLNYINEIPLGTRPKLEVSTKLEHNPIKQDVKKGKLRDFTYGDIPFNYGMLPQTFEDPETEDAFVPGVKGDADPVDVVELAAKPIEIGALRRVRVIGCLGLIDEGEMDWKILAVDAASAEARIWQDAEKNSGDAELAKRLRVVHDWFLNYKTTDGKPQNTFAFKGEVRGREFALKVIAHTNQQWKQLLGGQLKNSKGLWIPKKSA
eukprot:TRINITY_DN17452_c0_g1_i1.p1 TRINITY_DN17452_c0_g1~~TRINITY_DN17452_c0_g1_i1.p1  ORF type:complete len:274 (-),score=55.22 TRINITY_DN17452_c0_g1_i1:74-868(-)